MIDNKHIEEGKESQITKMRKNLDKFIQDCLNKYKFVEVKREYYNNVGEDVNSIISHKSTIPDLVIWNKTFNKNECFQNMKDLTKYNKYPRVPFYLRLNNKDNKNKNRKRISEYKSQDDSSAYQNLLSLVDKLNINKDDDEDKEKEKERNVINEFDKNKKNNEINDKPLNKIIFENNKFSSKDNKGIESNCENKNYIEEYTRNNFNEDKEINHNISNYVSPISKTKKTMNDYYLNQFKQNELLMNYVYSYLDKKGWIVFRNDGVYLSNFTSFDLFTFLTNVLKNNSDLKMFSIGMQTDPSIFNGEQIYIILSQTLPIILQKKKLEYKTMRKKELKEKEDKNLVKLGKEEKENISNNYLSKNLGIANINSRSNPHKMMIHKDLTNGINENNASDIHY